MTAPSPSAVRVVRIYSGAQMLTSRGITPLDGGLKWPDKHPLDDDLPWWINATGWLTDPSGKQWDTIGQISVPQPSTIADTALSITDYIVSADGMQAGIYFKGGTPGARTPMNFTLVGATTGAVKGITVTLPIEDVPIGANPPDEATLHGAVVTIGGFVYPVATTDSERRQQPWGSSRTGGFSGLPLLLD